MTDPLPITDEYITGEPSEPGTDPKDSKPGGVGWKPKPANPGEKKPSVQYMINPDPDTPAPVVDQVVVNGNAKYVDVLLYKYPRPGTTTTPIFGTTATTPATVATTPIPEDQFTPLVSRIKVPPNGVIKLPPGTTADVVKVVLQEPEGTASTYTVVIEIHACIKPPGTFILYFHYFMLWTALEFTFLFFFYYFTLTYFHLCFCSLASCNSVANILMHLPVYTSRYWVYALNTL